jgi:hypothetical protein
MEVPDYYTVIGVIHIIMACILLSLNKKKEAAGDAKIVKV